MGAGLPRAGARGAGGLPAPTPFAGWWRRCDLAFLIWQVDGAHLDAYFAPLGERELRMPTLPGFRSQL